MPQQNARNIVLVLAYDGTDFFGFQSQGEAGLPTIQETLEKAVFRLTGEKATVAGSGRTDTGVHAWGQAVHFFTKSTIPPERWALALAQYLPDSIVVRGSREASPDFHARFSAKEKTYIYQIYRSATPSPFFRRYAYHVPYTLDVSAMREAAAHLIGSHDFRSFCAAGSKTKSFVREIGACGIEEKEPLLTLRIRGSGFLWHMVRIIAGTLLEVGSGKRRAEDIPVLLKAGDRRLSGVTLPPEGLILQSVHYDGFDTDTLIWAGG